jgi:hypothetical protein
MDGIRNSIDTRTLPVCTRTYREQELSKQNLTDLAHAEANKLVGVARGGGVARVDFYDLNKTEFIPETLFHVRHPQDAERVAQDGLAGDIYVQTHDLSVEPNGISLYRSDIAPAIFALRPSDVKMPFTITLDPECFIGIPGEYLKAFIVHTKERIPLQKLHASIETIRRGRPVS